MSMNGIDISNHQAGLNLAAVPCDFVICKATEGTSFVDKYCDGFVQKAISMGKPFGVYHFASGKSSGRQEAEYFYNNIKNYVGKGILVLDWEADAVKKGVPYAKEFLNRLEELTGVKALIYMSNSVVNAYDWTSVVSENYGLWNAGYYAGYQEMGYNPSAPLKGGTGAWPFAAIYQYTSSGRLSGYSGNLDLNVFYGDAEAWKKYAGYAQGLGQPVFIKQKETLDIGFNFSMPGNQGRFKWLLYDVAKNVWETLVDWTASNWISLKKDKSGAGYLVQCQLYDLDQKNAHLIDTKTVGTDAGTGTVINGTYAAYRSDGSILIGCSSNNADVSLKMKVYNCTTKKWFTQFDGQWASFTPDKGTNYIIQFEAYAKDGTLLDYRSIGI